MVAAVLSGVGGFVVGVTFGVLVLRRRGGGLHIQVDAPDDTHHQ